MAVTRRPPGPERPSAPTARKRAVAKNPPVARKPPVAVTPPARRQPPRSTQALSHGPVPRPLRGSVSLTSAQRFARRVRARRRRRAVAVLAVLAVLTGVGWAALFSPWARVQRIEVQGTDRVDAGAVQAVASAELGRPLLLVRTTDVAARVRRMRLVRAVSVSRDRNGTLRVVVTERRPVAALPIGRRLALVDGDGVVVEEVDQAPVGLPQLQVRPGARGVPALRGCLEVLAGLPAGISKRLLSIGASSPDGIRLRLRDRTVPGGVEVAWGDSSQTGRKAEVLNAMMLNATTLDATAYDVRSPQTPAYRNK